MSLSGKVVVITGGTGGLGQAVTLGFLRAGATCAVTYIKPGPAQELKEAAGEDQGRLLLSQADVTDPTAIDGFLSAASSQLGGVNALLHLAGGFSGGEPVAKTSPETFDRLIALNLKSAFLTCRATVPYLIARGSGKIVLVSARAALKGTAGLGAYSISKAGVLTLTETLADELRDHDIQANCILPSIIDTPDNRRAMPDADWSRWVAPTEITRVLLFLVGPDARAVSGAAIPVYGRA